MRSIACDYCNANAELAFCSKCAPEYESSKILKLQILELTNKLQEREKLIERMALVIRERDGVYTKLKDLYRKNKTLEEEQHYFIKEDDVLRLSDYLDNVDDLDVYQWTITFDPSYFDCKLTSQYTQREYIKSVLYLTLMKFKIDYMFGCFELHKSGIVHCHVIFKLTEDHLPNLIKNFIAQYFTKRDMETQRAVRCDLKDHNEAFNYITKTDTKGTEFDNNYIYYILKKNNLNL